MSTPFILYSVFIVCLIPLGLAWICGYFRYREFGSIDNHQPRQQQAQLRGIGARALAAQQNAWEAAIMYCAAVFIAFASGQDLKSLLWPAVAFICVRVLHGIFYLSNQATLRSLSFVLGVLLCLYIAFFAAIFR